MKYAVGWLAGLMLVVLGIGFQGPAVAQPVSGDALLNAWLMRVHQAARQSVYTGTFVVSSSGGMASARIWHVCDGTQQLERVESLSGAPRAVFRHNDQVVTFYPQSRVAVAEVRESLGLFPNLLKSNDSSIGDFYQLKAVGNERIAGFDSEIFQLVPKDQMRYGYRVWSEKKTGLIIQLQTLDLNSKILEQSAFSELHLGAVVNVAKLSHSGNTDGYRVVRPDLQKTTADAQGWTLQKPVDGFKPMGCYQRPAPVPSGAQANAQGTMQWVFSDGVATVSLFVEPFDSQRHAREGATDTGGATHILTRRIDNWWATAVGEVPLATLTAFTQALARKK
ncbi:MAG: MucB/RseB C-terminal domain-containing protein [Rhodoferax sp.]